MYKDKGCTSKALVIDDSDGDEALAAVPKSASRKFARGDVRTFMFGQSLNDSVSNQLQSWSCDVCTLVNPPRKIQCEACGTAKRKNQRAPPSPPNKQIETVSSEISSELPGTKKVERKFSNFYFSASSYTGRIFLYTKDKTYLNAAFMPEDVKTKEDWVKFSEKFAFELGDLNLLTHTQKFVAFEKWNGLRAIDQQQLCGVNFSSPSNALNKSETTSSKAYRH